MDPPIFNVSKTNSKHIGNTQISHNKLKTLATYTSMPMMPLPIHHIPSTVAKQPLGNGQTSMVSSMDANLEGVPGVPGEFVMHVEPGDAQGQSANGVMESVQARDVTPMQDVAISS